MPGINQSPLSVYNLHFAVRMDTPKRCYTELMQWRNQQFPKQARIF